MTCASALSSEVSKTTYPSGKASWIQGLGCTLLPAPFLRLSYLPRVSLPLSRVQAQPWCSKRSGCRGLKAELSGLLSISNHAYYKPSRQFSWQITSVCSSDTELLREPACAVSSENLAGSFLAED